MLTREEYCALDLHPLLKIPPKNTDFFSTFCGKKGLLKCGLKFLQQNKLP